MAGIEVALGDPGANAETLRTAHERVLVAVMQQQHVIDALLTLARGQVGLQQPRHVDLATIAELVVESRREEAQRRGLTMSSSLASAPSLGDERLVERLIINLVDNALQHNRTQGQVEIRTSTSDGNAHLDVMNTGPVIPEDAIERIFQPFRRLDTDRTHNDGRLGLGLSIVRAIADTHHATISTQPLPDGGLHIRITFAAAGRASSGEAAPVQRS
jgi:signal transduction histidine kinase